MESNYAVSKETQTVNLVSGIMQKEFRDVYSEPGSHENFSVYPSLVFFLSISRNLISICYSFKSLSDLKA
jgi:hypothetical protein